MIAIAAVLIGLRLHLRLGIQRRRLDASDIFICLAWIASIAGSSMDVVAYCFGALSSSVTNTMVGYHGTDEQTLVLMKVCQPPLVSVSTVYVKFPMVEDEHLRSSWKSNMFPPGRLRVYRSILRKYLPS